jgi:ring-1,2-phenylacetyl-CoA epoxidase subunit PaaD
MSILSSVSVESLVRSVADAVASVHDPEYPDVSIADLGLVESVTVSESGDVATIGLIPTFSGCPALDMIATDVEAAVLALTEVQQCNVEWLPGPVWTNERLTDRARTTLADEFTVACAARSVAVTLLSIRASLAPPDVARSPGATAAEIRSR